MKALIAQQKSLRNTYIKMKRLQPKQFLPFFICLVGLIITIFAWSLLDGQQNTEKKAGKADFLRQNKAFPDELHWLARTYPNYTPDIASYQNILLKARKTDAQTKAMRQGKSGFDNEWVLQGPSNISGRINVIALDPSNPDSVWYVGAARGGVFKTTNAGTNWTPIFDAQNTLSIGAIAIDPTNTKTIYVGTGDVNISSFFAVGDGLYKSTDGGQTWQNIGLKNTYIISDIVINAQNPAIVYVSSMGNPMLKDTTSRGIFKTEDGGKNWEHLFSASDRTGVIDLEIDPVYPETLYAATWDRIRSLYESSTLSAGQKIFKTINGGDTWQALGNGLPTTDSTSRVGLSISHQNNEHVFCVYVGNNEELQGIYKSENSGEDWSLIGDTDILPGDSPLGGFGWYFGKLHVNPFNDQQILMGGVYLFQTKNGGTKWELAGSVWSTHADKHDIAFIDEKTLLLATDGGLYKSTDGGTSWTDVENLPITQFYRVAYNPHLPGTYYGGAQDNGTLGGNSNDLLNWQEYYGADGFLPAFSPFDANIMFAAWQNGGLVMSLDAGNNFDAATDGIDNADRINWDMPYVLSPIVSGLMFCGTHRVYKSTTTNGFPVWEPISDDLTQGNIYGARFHNISTVEASPHDLNIIFAGTSDGRLWRSLTGGTTWDEIVKGLPNLYFTSVKASPQYPNQLFCTVSQYKGNGDIPLIYSSNDLGENWTGIQGNLPPFSINDLEVLPNHADSVLFVATDGGVYGSLNAGKNWERLGNNMPWIGVFDLAYDPVNNRLIAGTHARSIMSFELDSLGLNNPNVGISQPQYPDKDNEDGQYQVIYNSTERQLLFHSLPDDNDVAPQVILFNQAGQKLLQTSLANNKLSLPLQLPQGLYFVTIIGHNRQNTQKVLIW